MKSAENCFVPVANLVIIKPIRQVEMKTLIKAAKLFLNGITEHEGLAYVHNQPLAYLFVQPNFKKPTFASLVPLWETFKVAELLFGKDFNQCPDKEMLLPYLLTKLCGDLLDNDSGRVSYFSEECGYAEKDGVITLKLSKMVGDYSYHNLIATFSESGFEVTIDGCWRGSQQDRGPVHHPEDKKYKGHLLYTTDSGFSRNYQRMHAKSAFALWGIDVEKTTAAIDNLEKAVV